MHNIKRSGLPERPTCTVWPAQFYRSSMAVVHTRSGKTHTSLFSPVVKMESIADDVIALVG